MAERSRTVLIACGAALALGTSALLAAQSGGGDRNETVAGWQIEDVADTSQDDPTARIVRMTRNLGNQELSYEIRLYVGGGTGWANSYFSAGMGWENRGCNESGGAAVETGAPAGRPARLRALLARKLAGLEDDCGAPDGTTAPLLDGFEAAFARLSSWHAVRLAEVEAAAETMAASDYGSNDMDWGPDPDAHMDVNMTMGADMTIDMNAADMSVDGSYSEMNYIGSNITASEYEAMEAAANALKDEPERR